MFVLLDKLYYYLIGLLLLIDLICFFFNFRTELVSFEMFGNLIDIENLELIEGAGGEVAAVFAITKVAALAYLMFNLFSPPCFAAIGAMNSEISDRKWFWGGVALQFATGYVMSFAIYQIGTYVSTGAVGVGFMPGLVVVGVIIATFAYLIAQNDKVAETKLYFEKQ